jgi:hypothetical protein
MSCTSPIQVPRKTINLNETYTLNKEYKLKMLFKDAALNLIDPSLITITLTKPNEEIVNIVDITKVETGFYYYTVEFDLEGSWLEVWSATINGQVIEFERVLNVDNSAQAIAQIIGLDYNSLIVIKFKEDIASVDGELLGKVEPYTFSTEYNPFYCSVEMMRLELGAWLNRVPDDTIALAIHWSSLEADNITGVRPTSERYLFARTRFVMFDAAVKLISMPLGESSPGSGKQKQLGDLLIQDSGTLDFNLKDLVQELKAERDEWWRVVNAGGCIVPGQGLGPTSALKGDKRADKNQRSREWHDPWNEPFLQPTQNSMYKAHGEKKYKHGYSGWNEYYYSSVTRVQRGGR